VAKTIPPLVICIWHDHVSRDEWQDKEEAAKEQLSEIRSVGWLIKEDGEAYHIVGDHDEGYVQVGRLMVVGKGLVKAIKVLRKGKRGGDGGVRRKRAAPKSEGKDIRSGADAGDKGLQLPSVLPSSNDVKG
jgi:hypothetical protein